MNCKTFARRCRITLAVLVVAGSPGHAGEIPGVPPPLLPFIDAVVDVYNVNDNLGRGKAIDDFRTQQLGFTVSAGERWLITVDHSILTLDKYADGGPDGRLDQMSASLGYRLWDQKQDRRRSGVTAGLGFRTTENFGGSRIQNGFHQLVKERIVRPDYIDTNDTDLAVWIRAEHAARLPWDDEPASPGGWRRGYWLHGATLATGDGQSDGTAIANFTLGKGNFDAWIGLRGDWRSGYDQDFVQSRVADNEEGGYVNVGVRYGPLLVETTQGFDDDKAFGRVGVFMGLGDSPAAFRFSEGTGMTVAVTSPRVEVVLQGRIPLCRVFGCSFGNRWRLFADGRYGKPSFGTRADKFIETWQVAAGVELEDRPRFLPRWLSAYASLGAGWRQEELFGEQALAYAQSNTEQSAVAMGDSGLRATFQPPDRDWRLRAQTGVTAWLPIDSQRVEFAGGTERILKPGLAILLGATLDF